MNVEQAQRIVASLKLYHVDAVVQENYAGRGRLGETCVGIVTDRPLLVGWAAGTAGLSFTEVPKRQDPLPCEQQPDDRVVVY